MSCYVIRIEGEDGSSETFGTWRSPEAPTGYAKELRERSSRYGGEGPEFGVSVEVVQRWPGLGVLIEEMA